MANGARFLIEYFLSSYKIQYILRVILKSWSQKPNLNICSRCNCKVQIFPCHRKMCNNFSTEDKFQNIICWVKWQKYSNFQSRCVRCWSVTICFVSNKSLKKCQQFHFHEKKKFKSNLLKLTSSFTSSMAMAVKFGSAYSMQCT